MSQAYPQEGFLGEKFPGGAPGQAHLPKVLAEIAQARWHCKEAGVLFPAWEVTNGIISSMKPAVGEDCDGCCGCECDCEDNSCPRCPNCGGVT
jgi:hypothetical protein